MIHAPAYIAVLDACVLYPAPVRDLLLSLADVGLFQPKWSEDIQREWSDNLLLNRPDLKKAQLQMTIDAMNIAFPDAQVDHYEAYISAIFLPDPDDRHVVAAAIRAKADTIVTYNLKDFPDSITEEFNIDILHPDDFLSQLCDSEPEITKEAFGKMIKRLKNPPKSFSEVLQMLFKSDLKKTVESLSSE